MIAGKHSVKVQILIQLSICFRYKSQQQALFGNKASNSTSTKDPGNSCFCITAVWSFPKGSQLHISQSLTCNTFGVFSGIFPRSWLRIIEPSKAPAMGALLSPTHSISASRLAAILHNSAETLAHTACKVTQWCKALHFCTTERKTSTFSEVHPLKQLTLGTQNRQTQSLEGPVLMVALAGTVRPQGRGCHLPSPAALRAVAPPEKKKSDQKRSDFFYHLPFSGMWLSGTSLQHLLLLYAFQLQHPSFKIASSTPDSINKRILLTQRNSF